MDSKRLPLPISSTLLSYFAGECFMDALFASGEARNQEVASRSKRISRICLEHFLILRRQKERNAHAGH
jgi:hypothetical protein